MGHIRKMDHVVAAMPTLVKLNQCDANLDLVTLHGVDAGVVRRFRTLDFTEGSFEAFAREPGAAVVGAKLAQRRGWKVGEAAEINEITFNVRGIYEDGGSTYESVALVHLNFLQQAMGLGRDSVSTQVYVKVDDARHAEKVVGAIDAYFSVYDVRTDTKPEEAFLASGMKHFTDIVEFSRFLGYLSVLIILVLMANTLAMVTQDRIQETAVLRTLGFVPGRIVALVLLEGMLICLFGGLLGAALSYAVLTIGQFGVGICGVQVSFTASPWVLGGGLLAACLVGFFGGLLPALGAARRNIVEGLREA